MQRTRFSRIAIAIATVTALTFAGCGSNDAAEELRVLIEIAGSNL